MFQRLHRLSFLSAAIISGVFLLCLTGCGDKAESSGQSGAGTREEMSAPDAEEQLPSAEDQEALQELARPAPPKMPRKGSLEAFFVECVTTLMVKGTEGFDKDAAIRRILDDLESLGLTQQGRPEGIVRDIVTRMVEDMESFRPEGYTADRLDDMARTMLRNLGKSYLLDIRGLLDPSLKSHTGKLRQAAKIDAKKVRRGYQPLTWAMIGGFTFKKDEPVPQRILDLDGQKVAHLGFMFPSKEYEDIHEFLLVESLWTCCFGEPPQVTDVVKVNLEPDKPGLFVLQGPVIVHGTFRVKVEEEDGWVIGVYRIDADHVEKYQ